MHKVRTRFSPSPTGMIHLGNARTAIFCELLARKNQGTFILRIEDTDGARSDESFVQALEFDLHWLGLNWQEGPGVDGDYGPYWQSQRQHIYAKYYDILEKKNLIYPCFCTDQELALARKLQLSRGQAPRYSGICKKLSKEEIDARIASGKKPSWRFAVPPFTKIEFDDYVKGPQSFATDDIGDFVVRRADGTAPFLFCNAIDDALMKISHVMRGEDHVANTPRQIMILQALDLPIPQYGHLSLIVGNDGAPLSKRHGSFSVHQIRDEGFLPLAILNYLARLGHTMDNNELLSFEELAKHFNIEKLSTSPARFDTVQLMYWQKLAIQHLDAENIWRWFGESVAGQVPEDAQELFVKTIIGNVEFPHDALTWAKIFFHDGIAFTTEDARVIREAGEQFFVEAEQAIEKYQLDFKSVLNEMKTTLNVQGKKLFMPLRIALTGRTDGPELAHIVEILGVEKVKHRFGQAFKLASKQA